MTQSALWLDGNALGGLLQELMGADVTSAPRRCHGCGSVHPVGAHRMFRGAGVVLRCPSCGIVALRVATLTDRHVVTLEGAWWLELPF